MTQGSNSHMTRRFIDAAIMTCVAMTCLMLLIYIAYGTTRRTYEQMLVDKSVAQAELIRSPLENYLRPGLPLRQFTGFNQLTTAILEGDKTLISAVVEIADGEMVFGTGNTQVRTLPPKTATILPGGSNELRKSDQHLQVILPLRNKFERVGSLVITTDRASIEGDVAGRFRGNLLVALLASLAFGIAVFKTSSTTATMTSRSVAIIFTGGFTAVAVAVIITMVSLFTTGAESSGRALVGSLGQRFDDIPQLGLQFDQIDGIDEVLDSYRQLNPNVSAIGITINGRIVVHTDRSRVGKFWTKTSTDSEYIAALTPPNHPRAAQVILSVPKSYVTWQVGRNVKNYAALFVASGLFAFLFLQLAQSIRTAHNAERSSKSDWRHAVGLELVKPVYFMAVFVDHLSYAFLPQFMRDLAHANGDGSGVVALPFTLYYFCFALALIPAGQYAQRAGSRNLVLSGLALIGVGLFAMAFATTLAGAAVARGLGGLGQGVLFIGVQSYILAKAQREFRTRANGIIVYGYQGGMISGMAIGSLLVGEVGAYGVFLIAALIALVAIAFTLVMVPDEKPDGSRVAADTASGVSRLDFWSLVRDRQFLRTIVLVGIPAKAVLTGVVLFAIPLLLSEMAFAKEDIGQITMIYAACVIVSSNFSSQFADRKRTSRALLVWGGALTTLGLIVIAMAGSDAVATVANPMILKAALFAAGAAIVGLAHGLINAPVVTHITDTPVAGRIGEGPTAAAYRLLERAGHIIGPVILGQLFLAFGSSPATLGWMALAMACFTLCFHLLEPAETTAGRKEEFA